MSWVKGDLVCIWGWMRKGEERGDVDWNMLGVEVSVVLLVK